MPTPRSQLCLSCSSTLLPRLSSSTPKKTSSTSHFPLDDKLKSQSSSQSQYYTTPCCAQPICSPCLERNPRLREWNPCLWCASGVGAVTGAGRGKRVRSGKDDGEEEGDERFEIGGDSEDEMEGVEAEARAEGDELDRAPPPPYQETPTAPEGDQYNGTTTHSQRGTSPSPSRSRSRSPVPSHRSQQRSQHSLEADREMQQGEEQEQEHAQEEEQEQEEEEEEVRRHTVRKGDTVRSLSLKYGIDPYDLNKLNSLPHSSLHSNPNLLQTRKTILLSRPKGDGEGVEGERGVVGVEEDERRREERRVKRFQILTKTPDPGIAKAYLALQSLDDSDHILTSQPGSTLFDADNDIYNDIDGSEGYESRQSGNKEGEKDIEKSSATGRRRGDNLRVNGDSRENRAVDKYYSDEEWAKQVEEEMKAFAASTSASGGSSGSGKGWLAGLAGIGGKNEGKGKGKGKGGFRKGEVVQGAPWIESR